MDPFTDLYDQIIQYERRIEEKQRFQAELKVNLQDIKNNIQRIEEDCDLLLKQLTVKEEQLSGMELDLRCLNARENVLVTQRDSLKEEVLALQQQLEITEEEAESDMVGFCQSVEDHSADLDLSASAQRARQHRASDTLQALLTSEQHILKELADYEQQKQKVSDLEADRSCQQQSLCDAAQTRKELEECLSAEKERLEQLQEERQHLAKLPHSGSEFTRLRNELASLHTMPLEQKCSELQEEINMLQNQLMLSKKGTKRQQKRQVLMPKAHDISASSSLADLSENVGDSKSTRDDEEEEEEDGGDNNEKRSVTGELASVVNDLIMIDDDGDDDMTLPDLELTEAEKQEAGMEGFRVVNRLKPVFKPMHC